MKMNSKIAYLKKSAYLKCLLSTWDPITIKLYTQTLNDIISSDMLEDDQVIAQKPQILRIGTIQSNKHFWK